MARAVFSISVAGNMRGVHSHNEVTGLGSLLERSVDFWVQIFAAFLVKWKLAFIILLKTNFLWCLVDKKSLAKDWLF